MTSPDWVPFLRRAAGLVTDGGGMTCHAAIVARELRIPCIVGTRTATKVLREGELVTLDGKEGKVYAGRLADDTQRSALQPAASEPASAPARVELSDGEPLATRVYVNLAIAEHAQRVAALPVDGVGLLRAEFMIADALDGTHPRQLIAEGKQAEFVSKMSESLLAIASAFAPRPVVYRTHDFRTNEFRKLRGGDQYEPAEENPMIGFRGCYRYVQDPALFLLELDVLARVREQSPNVHVMIPFVRTLWELEACLALIDGHALGKQRGLLRWVMAEVPSVAYRIPEYAKLGVNGVSIGSNDLTQLMLGVDRDSALCAELFEPEEVLGLVGLGDRLDHFPAQLSGGEQQRVAIARAVAKRPSVLLCDEPTGALDFRTGILVLEVIERINRELGTAAAVITHNAPIAQMADRVVTLADGRIQSQRIVPRRGRASELAW
jgi:pyruvate,water dikinase